jgi:hypothetical protein
MDPGLHPAAAPAAQPRGRVARTLAWLAGLALLLAAYLPVAGNAGWFSHDELQWGALADVAHLRELPFVPWGALETFQWRPLTFNLWLLLDWASGDIQRLHQVWLALAGGVSMLLFLLLRRLGAAPARAGAAVLAFALGPYAMYVHGWVATLADLLWVAAGLAGALGVLRCRPERLGAAAACAALATTVGLFAKEAAIALPALALLACWLARGEARWRGALLGSALPVALYLALRLPTILWGERPGGTYAWSFADIPLRWGEAHVWPFLHDVFEPNNLPLLPFRKWRFAALLALILAACAWRASPRLGVAYVLGGAACLGPALLLDASSPQYGYAFAAWSCATLALAWPRLRRWGRAFVLLAAGLTAWHGLAVRDEMLRVGVLSTRFVAELQAERERRGGAPPPALAVERGEDRWLYQRLVLGVPSGARLATEPGQADLRVRPDGTLAAARRD